MQVRRVADALEKEFQIHGDDATTTCFGRKSGRSLARRTTASITFWWLVVSMFLLSFAGLSLQNCPGVGVLMVLVAFAEMSAIEKALRYGDVMRARLRDLIDKGIAHRTPDERDFDDDFRAGNEE